ncbi:hypothetical protein HYQ44_017820 [Verticillium longisporum]|nr:hypothetical protein HYQ44_017820 [Verticillium longisporum]
MENNPKASFHVTLDMEKDAIENPDLDKLPHEIYRIRRKADGTLTLSRLPDQWLSITDVITTRKCAGMF